MGSATKWMAIMMMCVSSVKYNVLWNDKSVGPITPLRGLRQGDPLSPYLFILCADGRTSILRKRELQGLIHGGIKICKGALIVSHLLFADDSLFFCRSTRAECMALKQVFSDYDKASGQAMNFAKSGIFFSRNVSKEQKSTLTDIRGIEEPLDTGRYLGLHR